MFAVPRWLETRLTRVVTEGGRLLLCNTVVSRDGVAQRETLKGFSIVFHRTGHETHSEYLRCGLLSSDIRCEFLIDQVSALTMYHYLLMKPHLEMQKGELNALICNIPYNLAADEALVDFI